jgi:hypothetical protein
LNASCEAKIEKRRTSEGVKFSISGTGDKPDVNAVLAEKLRLEFGVELPAFTSSSVEAYFSEVAKLSPRNMIWRVRRQITIGVFPSARMAMYHDLDPTEPSFPNNEIVQLLLAGNNADSSSPFADEYEVDDPEIEGQVPFIVMDADSSQFSTLVDVAAGKNLAIEGPPGTGKSQTIVNAIAAALAEGKKVLFVAEKLAALNVVKSRLEVAGLGEFLLPLQAERSSREQVITSVRERMEMKAGPAIHDYDKKLKEYRLIRQQIDSGLTIRDVLGKSIATNPKLVGFQPEMLERCKVPKSFLTLSGLALLRQLGTRITVAYRESASAQANWKSTKLLHPERFTIEEACDLAGRASEACFGVANARDGLADAHLQQAASSDELAVIDAQLEQAQCHLRDLGATLLLNLLRGDNAKAAQRFIGRCEAYKRQREQLSRVLADQPSAKCLELIGRTADICERLKLPTIDRDRLTEELEDRREFLKAARSFSALLRPLVESRPECRSWHLSDIAIAHRLVKEAGWEAVLNRNARTSEPDGVHLLQCLCSEGKELRAQHAELADTVSFEVETSLEVLSDCVSTIRVAGAFRICSPRYHKAKRIFRSVAHTQKFDKQKAVNTLEDLIAFKKRVTEFSSHPHALAVFGINFKGIQTDFDRFERLATFYRGIDSRFGKPDKKTLRTFLREADIAELQLLPAIPRTDVTITFNSLLERMQRAEEEVRALTKAIAALGTCVHVFADPKTVIPDELRQITDAVRSVIDEQAALDECEEAKNIFGGAFEGSRTLIEPLRSASWWATAAEPHSQLLSTILAANQPAEARRRISDVLEAERTAQEFLARVAEIAKIDSRHFTDGYSWREVAQSLDRAAQDAGGLFAHAIFATVVAECPEGLHALIGQRLKNNESLDGLAEQFEAVAVRQMAKAVYASSGSELMKYRGSNLDELRRLLAERDREIIKLSRAQLRTCAASPGQRHGPKVHLDRIGANRKRNKQKTTVHFGPRPDATGRSRSCCTQALLDDVAPSGVSVRAQTFHLLRSMHHRRGIANASGVGDRRATSLRPDDGCRRYEPASAQ